MIGPCCIAPSPAQSEEASKSCKKGRAPGAELVQDGNYVEVGEWVDVCWDRDKI